MELVRAAMPVVAALLSWTVAHAGELPDLESDPLLLHRSAAPPQRVADQLDAAPAWSIRPYPANGATVVQNPPVLRWPWDAQVDAWQVRLRLEDGSHLERSTGASWLFLQTPLPPGRYAWQVRAFPAQGEATAWSGWRRFTVPRNARVVIVPPAQTAFAAATNQARPRALPPGAKGLALQAALRDGQRSVSYADFVTRQTETLLDGELPVEPPTRTDEIEDEEERIRTYNRIAGIAYGATAELRAAALIWATDADKRFLDEAMRRARHLLSWDPAGSTGIDSQDHVSREIMLSLAMAVDLTHEHWPADERARAVSVILARGQDLYDRYLAPHRPHSLRVQPANSHGYRHAGAVLAAAALLAGEHPRFEQWWSTTFAAYVAVNNPWGGDDGGFANGVAYASWNLEDFLWHWDLIYTATGFDIADMAWPQQVGWFLTYFVPAQSPGAIFGDGAEHSLPEAWSRLAHSYAARVPKPVFRAHAQAWSAQPPASERMLFAPLRPDIDAGDPGQLPQAAVFPDIGWTAMHSDLADPLRSSIYFRSSPYGSFNHGHASQNEFVVHSRGRVLALASGYYDRYGSDHHNDWTRTTRAHNAVSFDDGQGQTGEDAKANGGISLFRHDDRMDVATGDATAAYGGALTEARRTLVYLRERDLVLVLDRLRSDTPRRWEWNIHTPTAMVTYAENAIGTANGQAQLCVEQIAGTPTSTRVSDLFPVAPYRRGKLRPEQWHATFEAREPSTEGRFLFALRLNCAPSEISSAVIDESGRARIEIGQARLAIGFDGATLSRESARR